MNHSLSNDEYFLILMFDKKKWWELHRFVFSEGRRDSQQQIDRDEFFILFPFRVGKQTCAVYAAQIKFLLRQTYWRKLRSVALHIQFYLLFHTFLSDIKSIGKLSIDEILKLGEMYWELLKRGKIYWGVWTPNCPSLPVVVAIVYASV